MTSAAETITKPSNWESLKEKVKFWIDGEQRCITVQQVSQTFDISRVLGTQLLKEVLQTGKGHQVSTCQQTQEGNALVFRLKTSTAAPLDEPAVSIFALSSLEATESVEMAHERDMVDWREMVQQRSIPSPHIAAIAPADEVERTENASPMDVDGKSPMGGQHPPFHPSVSRPLSSKSKQPTKPPKMMTASSFFGSQATKKASQENKAATKTKKSAEKTPAISKPVTSKPSLSRKENHKPSEMNRSMRDPKVGNADDFVADEEESDDEMPPAKREPVRLVKDRLRQTSEPPLEQKSPPIRGSMDDFAKGDPKPDPKNHQKKRRKKLVDRTTMVGGYLRTETVTVWEDILTDEEEEKRNARAKKMPVVKRKTASNMKQKSLMGFFAKK